MSCKCEPSGSGDAVVVAGALIVVGAATASAVTGFLAVAATVLLIAGYLAALVCVVLAMAALALPHVQHRCGVEAVDVDQAQPAIGSGVAGVLGSGSLSSLGDVIEVSGEVVER